MSRIQLPYLSVDYADASSAIRHIVAVMNDSCGIIQTSINLHNATLLRAALRDGNQTFTGQQWIKNRVSIGKTPNEANPDDEILLRVGSGNSALADLAINAPPGATGSADLIGISLAANLQATLNLTDATELEIGPLFTDDGTARTITDGYGIHVKSYAKGANTTVTTMYGLRIRTPTLGGTNIGARIGGGLQLDGATSGTLLIKPAAVAGTNTLTLPAGTTDFSATGAANNVVQQTSAGGALTVGQLAASNLSNGTTGSGSVVLATSPSVTGLDVTDGLLKVKGQVYVSFTLFITNAAGTIKHQIVTDTILLSASNFATAITGASATAAATPQVAAGVDFTNGVGLVATDNSLVAFNTAAQTSGDMAIEAAVAFNSSGTAVLVEPFLQSININGTTRARITLEYNNATSGATFALTTANIAAGKGIAVRIQGFVK